MTLPRRRRPPTLIGLFFVVWLCSCDSEITGGHNKVAVGVILPFQSHAVGHWAQEVRKGLELALTSDPSWLRFEFVDNNADPVKSADLVHALTKNRKVRALIGCFTSPCCLAAAERAEALQIPLITPSGTHPDITNDRDWVFRVCFQDDQQGARMAGLATELGLSRIGVIREITNDYSLELASSLEEGLLQAGGEVVSRLSYRSGEVDELEMASWMESFEGDAVFLPGYYADVSQILKATVEEWQGRPITFLGGDGWEGIDESMIPSPPPYGIYITSHFAPDAGNSEVEEFLRLYERHYPDDPVPRSVAALGFDAGRVLVKALMSGARSTEEIRDAIVEVMLDFEGATGRIHVDPVSRERHKAVGLKRWDRGKWVAYP